MRFNDYQKQAIAFRAKDLTDRESKLTMTLGLCSEAGEAGDMVKKHIGHGHDIDKQALCKELGDVLWYIAAVADKYGISMNDIALNNLKKLNKRYKSGKFTSQESINRTDKNNKSLYTNVNNKEIFSLSKKDLVDKEMMRGPLKYKSHLTPLPADLEKWKEIFTWKDINVQIFSSSKKSQEKTKNFDPRLIAI